MEYKELELKHLSMVNYDKYFISTIRIEVRHLWLNQQSDLFVYETMVFKTKNDNVVYHEPILNQRYESYEKAITGHQNIIDDIKKIVKDNLKSD